MKKNLSRFWEKGYLYLCIAAVLYLAYGLSESVGIYDWQKEIAYFQYIHKSLLSFHTIPYFWWNKLDNIAWYPAVSHTSNFISNPETLLFSPFTPMLLLLNEIGYIKFIVVVHFMVGVIGLLVLRKQLQWNDLQFRTYAILFLFSPVIIQHLAIGYTPWLNLFFFPWIIYFVAHKDKFLGTLGLSLILAWVLLQGGTHPFVWFASFILLYFISCAFLRHRWSYLFRLPFIFGLVIPLSLIRLYATVQTYGDFHQAFQAGYNPLNFLLWSIIPPLLIPKFDTFFVETVWSGVPSWDGGIFWGASLPMLSILLIKYKRYRKRTDMGDCDKPITVDFDALLITSSILLFFSFFSSLQTLVKGINDIVYIPFSEGVEKYPFRLAIPALLGYSIVISNYSQNIWQDMHAWIIKKRTLLHIMPKCITVLKYAAVAFSMVCLLTFAASPSLSHMISKFLDAIITEAYHATGSQRLSQFMAEKSLVPLGHYLNLARSNYLQMQSALIMAGVLLALTWLVIRNRAKFLSLREGFPYAEYELLLAVPLLFSSAMWLSLAMSVPYKDYSLQDIAPPHIVTQSGFSQPNTIVTPQTLFLYPRNPMPVRYLLPNVLFSDSRFLTVTSNNAILSDSDGNLSILPQSEDVIVLDFKSSGYVNALIFTTFSWIVVICIFILKRRLPL